MEGNAGVAPATFLDRFLSECEEHMSKADPGSLKAEKCDTLEKISAQSRLGHFELISVGRENGNGFDWCDSVCQICDADHLPGNYEIHFKISGEGKETLRHLVDLIDVCKVCTRKMFQETSAFKQADEAWAWIQKTRPLG